MPGQCSCQQLVCCGQAEVQVETEASQILSLANADSRMIHEAEAYAQRILAARTEQAGAATASSNSGAPPTTGGPEVNPGVLHS